MDIYGKKDDHAELDRMLQLVISQYEEYDVFPHIPSEGEELNHWLRDFAAGKHKLVEKNVMTLNEDDLILGELILLEWAHGRPSDTDDYPDYFHALLGIDPQEGLDNLLNQDYLDILEEDTVLHFMSLIELNEVFEEHDLPTCQDHDQAVKMFRKEFSGHLFKI